jgi:hypothetical protein
MLRTVNLLAFVGVLYFAGAWGMQWLRAPWSLSALGPTLTGVWEGPLQSKLGASYRLYLDLRYRSLQGRLDSSSNLTGQARICTRTGTVYEFTVDGEASRSGDQIELRLTYADPAQSALRMELAGRWNGQTLALQPLRNPFMPDGTFVNHRTVSSTDPDDGFQLAALQPGDAPSFLIACGRLTW